MSDSVWPHRRLPTRLPRPWDSPGKNTGAGCHFLLQCMRVKSEVAQSCLTLSDPMDCSPPGSSAVGFSRQEYWSGVPLPSPNSYESFQIKTIKSLSTEKYNVIYSYNEILHSYDNQQISVKQGWISQIEPEVNAYIAYNFTYIKFEMNKSNWH